MNLKSLCVMVLCLALALASTSAAQTAPGTSPAGASAPAPVFPFGKELCVYFGYAWTFSQDFDYYNGSYYESGEVDIADNTIWGVSLDIPVRPGMWAELLFSQEKSDLTFKSPSRGEEAFDEFTFNYWQIGGVQALKMGKVVPFTSLSLGATNVSSQKYDESEWYFSMILGAGAKIHMNERLGLRLQARLPITFTGGGLGAGVGTGGASVGFYGTGVTQFDLSAGAFVSF